MRVTLRIPRHFVRFLDSLERLSKWIWVSVGVLLGIQVIGAMFLRQWATRELLYSLAGQALLIVLLWFQLRRRNSLRWRANHFVHSLREPIALDLRAWFKEAVRFRRLESALVLWIAVSAACFPFYGSLGGDLETGYFGTLLMKAEGSVFTSLWQVHATLLALFVVLLTFVFQLINVRQAYETSLLPFLARKALLKPIITINSLIILLHMYTSLQVRTEETALTSRYLSVVGLIFLVASSIFLLAKVLELLAPDALDQGLRELTREEFMKELEDEQVSAVAQDILAEECGKHEMEYSPFDFRDELAAIRSPQQGNIIDIDLSRLGRFASGLSGRIPVHGSDPLRAVILATLDDEVGFGHNVLGRVVAQDNTTSSQLLLRRSFKIASR